MKNFLISFGIVERNIFEGNGRAASLQNKL